MNKKNPLVFLDMSIDGDPFERMVFELFSDVVPRTADNFRALCTGEKGISSKCGKPLHYKGTFFHRIIRGSMAQGGDFLGRDGDYGESIYGGKFPDESSKLKYDGPGLLSIAIADRDTRGSLFNITFKGNRNLDRKHVVFGRLVHGHDVLKKIETAGDEEGRPTVTVKIINSGEIHNDKMKVNKSKIEVDACGTNSHEVKRREKHKKSAKNRRKKRRYYSSESESSFSSETKSSESDGDSDSYTSSSDVSSSSDDRRRKRKRSSKRDKYKRGKRKDKRHEKKRKRHDKRSKHKSKRMRNDLSASESESKSKSSENNGHIQGPDQKQKNEAKMIVDKQPLDEEREDASLRHKELETTDMIETEEGEFPKENGEHQSNGSEGNSSSKESSDVEPDVMDDRVGKSRSQSASPKRAASKGMSVSPRRSLSGSRSVSPARSLSRSRTVSRGPPWISRKSRSISRSPVRSGSSRSLSAERGRQARSSISRGHSPSPPKRSLSRSSLRTSSRKSLRPSVSRSPVKVAKSIIRNPRRSSRRSISRSPPISSRRSISRSSGRAPSRKHTSPSHSRSPASVGRRVKSPVSDRGRRSSRSLSRDGASMRIRRGRGFSDRYAYGRRYRSPSPVRSPVRSNRFGGHYRYSSYRRSPRRYRSPSRGITPPRYRSRKRSRTPSVSRSPIRHRRRYSRSPIRRRYTRSPARSHSPVARSRYRSSPHATHRRRSPSRSRSLSGSRSSSHDSLSPPPKQPTRAKSSSRSRSRSKSRSSSGSPLAKRGHVVSYGDGSPDSGRR